MNPEIEEANPTETETDTLAPYREQVRAEASEKAHRGKMSEAAVAKFREQREDERVERAAESRFANAIASIQPTPENLKRLIARCSTDQRDLDRRAYKLAYWIERGYKLGEHINTPQSILWMSTLTLDDIAMS